MTKRIRIDSLLVDKELAETLDKARARILAGEVIVNDQRIDKPGTLIDPNASVRLRIDFSKFVSRGGTKLEAAINEWPTQIKNSVCIDVGSSTGGFTDVLLQKGAKKVYAVDVGYNQLAYTIRTDPRVVVMERTHILKLDPNLLVEKPQIAVVDVSFISLIRVLPKITQLLAPRGITYALIKPQFEVEPKFVEKGGIVRDIEVREKSVAEVIAFGKTLGLENSGVIESPIPGADGNIEYLTQFSKMD